MTHQFGGTYSFSISHSKC